MLSVILLAALIKLNLAIEKPMVPAAIFTVATLILGVLLEQPLMAVVIGAAINFGLSFLFFLLLKRTEGQGSWWFVVVGGILIYLGVSVGIRFLR